MLWRSDLVHVNVLATTEQEIHAMIRVRSQSFTWLISAIYASPRFEERCMLWNNLRMLANMHDLSWALMGDFNEVLSVDEKYGGNPICQRRVRAIRECMNDCSIMDLGFTGPKYTWTNKRELGNLIQCRLDRCWINPGWKELYPEANVTHLARINSDHCPLLLNLYPFLGSNVDRPFRFQPIWLSHSDFPVVVRDAWAGREGNLAEAISNFKTKAQRWNREVFGNVFLRKKKILARMLGAEKALAVCPNSFLINLQKQLAEEYNLVLQIEEELWAMKSRTSWVIAGERNTSFFHISALKRRSKNRITCVQNNEGEWCHNVEEVKEIFNSSFKKLYKTKQVFCPTTPQ
ncbi:uncharacterized protein LOC115991179 [Quercus lobata]|uniref:uncharacterized protein LOC115991179 n=1 Tax=Quercus lobata TaxID=97700 RepID=UPI0012493F94|nr:uncharacterized protein LOC115991179 [Quercus lobata]